MYSIEFKIRITSHQKPDSEEKIRELSLFATDVFSQYAELWEFDYQDSHFWYHPDEAAQISGRNAFGLAIRLRRRVQQLKSTAYLLQVFESSCRLVELKKSQIRLELTVNLK